MNLNVIVILIKRRKVFLTKIRSNGLTVNSGTISLEAKINLEYVVVKISA
ncbi:MAG: hypothetical protein LBU35_03875 [Holosporales bacterium]|nr:hypothetical protein [Holosporales bacterium]